MNVLVLYYSRSGNTLKLAEAVAEGVCAVDGAQCLLKSTSEVTKEDFVGCSALIAGSPVYFGGMASELKRVFDEFVNVRKKMENKIGAAFATGGGPSGGKETTLLSIIQAMLIYGMIIAGDPMDASGHYGVACIGSPDAAAKENARKLGRRVAELAKKLAS
ncbi:MAG: NAD(P)H-dependent oxidoreductase [Desulfomonilia bacterium]|jgi:NAD(P)H dehydrogenase (quinone)